MSDSTPPSNVKVYDRPESKRISPVLLLLIALVVLALGYFGYRKLVHHTAQPTNSSSASPTSSIDVRQLKGLLNTNTGATS